MTPREHEHTLNVWLAEALKKRGLNAVAERPGQHRHIDVKVTLQRARGAAEVVVAVEAEQGQNPAKMAEAIRDAEARLTAQQNLARCAIALCYPDLTTPESLPSAALMWTVRDGQQDAGSASWQTGNVDALAAAIRLAPAFAGIKLSPLTPAPDPPRMPRMPIQTDNFNLAYTILGNYYHSQPDVAVTGECYLCDDKFNITSNLRPDCLVAFGMTRPKREIVAANAYIISEIGKPPDFVLEVGSLSTGRRDYTIKRDVYAAQQVPEYWRFDHSGGDFHDAALAGDRLVAPGVYQPIPVTERPDGVIWGYSAVLELELHWVDGRLRFWNRDTRDYLYDLPEMEADRDAEAAGRRAAEAAQRATADQLDAALIDRDANAVQRDAARGERDTALAQLAAEAAAHQSTADQLAAAQELIRQLQAQQQ